MFDACLRESRSRNIQRFPAVCPIGSLCLRARARPKPAVILIDRFSSWGKVNETKMLFG